MASAPSRRLLSFSLLWTMALPALSQEFKWNFVEEALAEGGDIPTCTPLEISIDPPNAAGPLYMISYAVDGTPQTELLQRVDRGAVYSVRHAPGSRLVLNVADSTGSSGGISPAVYNVIAGDSTDCVVAAPAQNFTIKADHTGSELQTCEPWSIAIRGGVPPYSISLASLGAPSVTNVTLESPDFNLYTYINRVPPGAQLLAAVSDSTGRWAGGVPLVNTEGAEDTDCDGATSTGGVATPEQLPDDAPTTSSQSVTPTPSSSATPSSSGNPSSSRASQSSEKPEASTVPHDGNNDETKGDETEDTGSAARSFASVLVLAASLLAAVIL